MEMAHPQTGILRVIGKFILLGLLVILLAKVILHLVVLAVVGGAAYLGARAVYLRRASFKHVILRARQMLLRSAAALLQATFSLFLATGVCVSFVFLAIWKAIPYACNGVRKLSRFGVCVAKVASPAAVIPFVLLRRTGKIGYISVGRSAGTLVQVSRRCCAKGGDMGAVACVAISQQSRLICGTFIEAASGALVGAMFGLVSGEHGAFPLFESPEIPVRILAGALFGILLGIALGLSRSSPETATEFNPLVSRSN